MLSLKRQKYSVITYNSMPSKKQQLELSNE